MKDKHNQQNDMKEERDQANNEKNSSKEKSTDIKNAHASGTGTLERTDGEQTSSNDTAQGLEGAEKY